MSWGVQTVEKQRQEFVERVEKEEKSKAALCREYAITRRTGDKWIARYKEGESMSDRSRAPNRTPGKTDEATEATIMAIRQKHPALGAKKIKRILENQGTPSPAYSTINAILHRNGMITKEASIAATPYKRFEKERPNELWQADFKGHFTMHNGKRCHPLAILDDHSRYCLCIDAKGGESYEPTKESFIRVFERYGIPDALLCDNGNPWGTSQSVGYTRFEVDLMNMGILPMHGRPLHPQTQGKEERFNGTLKKECIRNRTYNGLEHAQIEFDAFRRFYNEVRPHHALGLDTPVTRFRESERRMPERIDEWEYGTDVPLRRVKDSGYLTVRGQGYYLSEAFGGLTVGVMESVADHAVLDILYRQFIIAKINIDDRVVIARKVRRLYD